MCHKDVLKIFRRLTQFGETIEPQIPPLALKRSVGMTNQERFTLA